MVVERADRWLLTAEIIAADRLFDHSFDVIGEMARSLGGPGFAPSIELVTGSPR
jgi:hypothetical protein